MLRLISITLHVFLMLPVALSQAGTITAQELSGIVAYQDLPALYRFLASGGIGPEAFEDLQAESVDIQHESERFVIVRCSNDFGENAWLYFMKDSASARELQLVSVETYGRYARLLEHPVPFDEASLLVAIESQQGSGTGVYLSVVTWQLLADDGVITVLEYPAGGAVVGWGLPFDREFASETLVKGWQDGVFVLEAVFSASYANAVMNGSGYGNVVLSYARTVRYLFDPSQGVFVVDAEQSQMSADQIDGLFNDGVDGFVVNNRDDLAAILAGGDEQAKAWLLAVLEQCEDGEAREVARDLLGEGGQ